MFAMAMLLGLFVVCAAALLVAALVGFIFHVVFRIALLPLVLAAGLAKVVLAGVAGVVGLLALAVAGPVLLVVGGVLLLPLLALACLVWAGGRLIAPV